MTEKNVQNNFDINKWNRWVDKSISFFSGLIDGSVIGILKYLNDDKILLLEKKDSEILVETKNPEDMDCPVADVLFIIKEENIEEILEDKSFVKFIELLSTNEINIFGLRNKLELIDRGYTDFLGKLGLDFGAGSYCGEETMKTTQSGCCEDSGSINETPKEKSGCCADTEESLKEEPKDDTGCGCGCGGEFPDESLVANPDKPEFTAEAYFFEEFEKFAQSMGIVSIGYTEVIPELINTEEPLMYPNAIVLTLEMGKNIIETAPGPEAQQLNDATYAKLGHITYALSDFLRSKGFGTQVAHPYGSLVSFSPLGQKAGIGWIGKSGLLITPELGPRQKISAIFTSIENLPIKRPDDYSWIPNYCDICSKCVRACPENAMIERKNQNGEKETEFKSELCIGCSQGCTYCIEDCPFEQEGYEHVKNKFDRITAKLAEVKKIKTS